MTIAIFIARESDNRRVGEFPLYMNWFSERKVKSEIFTGCFRVKSYSRISSQTRRIQFRYCKIVKDDLSVFAVEKDSEFMPNMASHFQSGKFADGEVEALIESLMQLLLETENDSFKHPCDIDLRIFAHWGINDVDAAEKDFRETVEKIGVENISGNENIRLKTFKSFAISTTRDTTYQLIFDKNKANLPDTVESVNALVDEFERRENETRSMPVYSAQLASTSRGKGADLKGCNIVLVPVVDICDFRRNVLSLAQILSEHNAMVGLPLPAMSLDEGAKVYANNFLEITEFYPLFLCAGEDNLSKFGATPPREFVVNFADFADDERPWERLLDSVGNRVLHWKLVDKRGGGISKAEFRSWCAGAFRIFCFMDKDVHGTGACIDWRKAKAKSVPFWRRYRSDIKRRLDGNDGLSWQIPLWERLFSRELKFFKRVVQKAQRPKGAFYDELVDNVFARPDGLEVAYLSPVRKLSGLLIDDDAENGKKEIEKALRKVGAGDAFVLSPIAVDVSKCDAIVDLIVGKFAGMKSKFETHDFVLLDLRLNDNAGDDPSGYYLISLIKQFFPNLPIIIYSRYDDMGHISRAFKMGADWFIRKDEIEKLPRHLLSILSIRNWRKEWDAIQRLELCNVPKVVCENDKKKKDFNEAYTEERKYLTCKCLEKLPGKNIEVTPTGGGFSSSATFRACKWSEDKKGARVYLQDPVIIKIDTAFNTMTEYERYFRFIRPYIANESGRVEAKEITLDHNNSAITYTFAGKNDSSRVLDTMKNMLAEDVRYMARCDYKKYEAVFDEIFNDILPKIHRVSPKNPNLESPISSYPNRIFGEKDTDGTGFIDNYLARIPLSRHFNVEKFANPDANGSLPFEMHGVATEGEKKVIEAYALRHDYSKLNVILTGDVVDHVARYRELRQGQTLWVDGDYVTEKKKNDNNQAVSKPEMDRVILGRLIEILYSKDSKNRDENGNPTFYDGEKEQPFDLNHSDGTKKEQSRNTFCKLVKTLILGHKPDDGKDLTDLLFDSIVYDMYKATCDLCTASSENDRFKCKVGIVHGDLNYANIMVDSKKDGTIDDAKDVWLIDFARTRRDIIAHDFNVIFTATFSQLFNNDLWNDKGVGGDERYAARITRIFKTFINDVMFAMEDEVPDYIAGDRRFTLFYKIFRRIRKAALSNDNMTEDMYTLTTALCCLYTFKVFLKYEKNIQGAAALLATAYICIKHLEEGKKDRNHNA